MILLCYGTRPEWIKIKPLIESFKGTIPFKVLFTGQHEHIGNFYHDYALTITNTNNRLDSIFSSILNAENNIFENIEYILVQGDTASTYATALTAFNRGVKVIHLEAGLRTYNLDNPYPEEAYRQMISRISTINFCATRKNRQNLIDEKCPGDNHIVGNTVLDNLVDIETSYGNDVIITMHRRENHPIMDMWFYEINELAKQNKDLNFIIPLHPNPNVRKHSSILTHVNIVDPLPYDKMIDKISKCRFLISDSGGIQEEGSYLNKKIIVCRKWTERTESVGTHSIMCEDPNKLKNIFKIVNSDFQINSPSPYGDGTAAKKITQILRSKI